MKKISELINPEILNSGWVGFYGDSEFVDDYNKLHLGGWSFVGVLSSIQECNGEIPFNLDDELPEEGIYGDYTIPVYNKNGTICAIQLHYKE